MITQLEFVNNGIIEFPVEGLATIILEGIPQREFALNCRSTVDNGTSVSWSRQDNEQILSPLTQIDQGLQLDLRNAGQNEITTYTCSDGETQMFIELTTCELKKATDMYKYI